jgi:hypothetical protein
VYPGYHYVIRIADTDDERALEHLAELDGQRPLSGPVLVGEIDGIRAAALSLRDGRIVADPFRHTAVLRQVLRMRASAMESYYWTPSLVERIRAGAASFRARTMTAPSWGNV